MARKRRSFAAPATPTRAAAPPAFPSPPSITTAALRSAPGRTTGALPALSPPLKKRVSTRRAAFAAKMALEEDDEEEEDGGDGDDAAADEEALRLRHMQPDPYLQPDDFRRRARVFRRGKTIYDAMLTRVSARQLRDHHSTIILPYLTRLLM